MDVSSVWWLTRPKGEEFRAVAQDRRVVKKQKKDNADAEKMGAEGQRQACLMGKELLLEFEDVVSIVPHGNFSF